MSPPDLPLALLERLRRADHVAVLTGAGVSAESGVPTFREAQMGLWARYDPQELATPEAFRSNPRLVWEWYAWRRSLVAAATPNAGHRALAQLQRYVKRLTLITQNVDGLHQQAGSKGVIELHGNLKRNKCFDKAHPVLPGDELPPQNPQDPPRCPRCHSFIRPDVVWFGESLPRSALKAAFSAARNCRLFLCIGTSAVVHPAASLPLSAGEAGATIVEINPNTTPLTPHADFVLPHAAGEILPLLLEAAWPGAAQSDG